MMSKFKGNKLRNNFEDVLMQFDFQKVHMVMNLLGWTWGGEKETPTVQDMEETVRELFDHSVKDLENGQNLAIHSTGGFEVEIHRNGNVFIRFILEEYGICY
jgi:hypothetical protein